MARVHLRRHIRDASRHLRRIARRAALLVVSTGVRLTARKGSSLPRGVKKGILVLGTGPSLKKYLKKISAVSARYSTLAVNSFCVSPWYEKLKPDYYVFTDPGYWARNRSVVSQNDRNAALESLTAKTSWPMTVVLPFGARNSSFEKILQGNENLHLCHIRINTIKHADFPDKHWFFKTNIYTPSFQNVLAMSIYVALLSGYKNICVFGADHDWFRNIEVGADNFVYTRERHFYKEKQAARHRFEWPSGEPFTMGQLFAAWANAFNGYYELRDFAGYMKARVKNMCRESQIDAFERGTIDSLE
jgi:hypothetical protein